MKDKDVSCTVCAEWYSKSKSGEPWIECQRWSHEACTSQNCTAFYVCDNCEAND